MYFEGRKNMTKELLKGLGLTDELADKVMTSYSEALKGFVPKSRFDELNEQTKQLKGELTERSTQLEDLKKSAGSNDELKKQIENLQRENTTKQQDYDTKIKQLQIDSALKDELLEAGVSGDVKQKMVKALLELANPELENGKIKGLADQIKKLQEGADTKSLFGDNSGGMRGMRPGDSGEPKSALDSLNAQLVDAQKSGKMANVIAIKNKIFEEQQKNKQ